MKKWVLSLALLFVLFPFNGKAQVFNENFNYGLGLQFNIPVFKPLANDSLGVKSGWGVSMYGEQLFNQGLGLQLRGGYDQTRYLHDFNNTITVFNNGAVSVMGIFKPEKMSETRFEFGLTGNYSFMGTREVLDGTRASGVRAEKYRPPVKNDLGLVLGIAFELKPQFLLRFNYTEYLFSKQFTDHINGRPDQLQIGLDIRFNKLREMTDTRSFDSAYYELTQLAEGKIVFMLSTRLSQLRAIKDSVELAEFKADLEHVHKSLVKAIYRYYNYSDFLICYDTAVSKFEPGKSYGVFLDSNMNFKTGSIEHPYYYAHVGENFYSEYRRSTSGIYIYNSNFTLLEYPFPFFTKYREKSDERFGAFNLEQMVIEMNHNLYEQRSNLQLRWIDRTKEES